MFPGIEQAFQLSLAHHRGPGDAPGTAALIIVHRHRFVIRSLASNSPDIAFNFGDEFLLALVRGPQLVGFVFADFGELAVTTFELSQRTVVFIDRQKFVRNLIEKRAIV